jgi:hypothetical protein
MLPCESSTDSNPPVGANDANGARGVSVKLAAVGASSLTRTTGVLKSLMINVAVLRGVGVLVRVGIGVIVGVLDGVGLFVGVLAGAGPGVRFSVEQASMRSTVERKNNSLRIGTSQQKVAFIIPPGMPQSYHLSRPDNRKRKDHRILEPLFFNCETPERNELQRKTS